MSLAGSLPVVSLLAAFLTAADSTAGQTGALTVAGQSRILTAFPSIRANLSVLLQRGAAMMPSNQFR